MSGTRSGLAVWTEAPGQIGVRIEEVMPPGPDEVTIAASVSLLSPGTELRVYRGQIAPDTDLGLETCEGSFHYPVKYGYQVVGRVMDVGANVPLSPGLPVFVRHPHQSLFTMRYDHDLVSILPSDVDQETAAFSNMMSVALNTLLDVPVRVGDDVVVFGQGPIGLFVAYLASKSAGRVWVIEPSEPRRRRSEQFTSAIAAHPDDAAARILNDTDDQGVDIAFEVSGSPEAFQQALSLLGVEGTLGVAAYYGDRDVRLRLSPEFHFKRHRIVSSQAGMVGSGLQPRWDRMRRLRTAWSLLQELPVSTLVSHRVNISDAAEAYRLLDQGGEEVFGIVLDYDSARSNYV